MKTFTEDEKIIAKNIDKEYQWMARDDDGNLCVFKEKPEKEMDSWYSDSYFYIPYFNHLFTAIRWEDKEPVRISDIYNPKILDYTEREYLKTVLKPFHGVVQCVEKTKNGDKEYLFIPFSVNGSLAFPDFDAGTMYSGMELDRRYSLDELGITYEEEDE